jgi:hypothetical protein
MTAVCQHHAAITKRHQKFMRITTFWQHQMLCSSRAGSNAAEKETPPAAWHLNIKKHMHMPV